MPVMDGPVSMAIRVIKITFREPRCTALLLYDFVTVLDICLSLGVTVCPSSSGAEL